MQALLILAVAVCALTAFVAGGWLLTGATDNDFQRRLAARSGRSPVGDPAPYGDGGRTLRPQLVKLLKTWGARAGGRRVEEAPRAALRARLLQAGFYSDRAVEAFFGLRVVCAAVGAFGGAGLAVVLGQSDALHFTGIVMLTANAGLFGPKLYLSSRIAERRRALHRALPDGIDLMVVSVEAGSTLTAALQRVVEEFWDVHHILTEQFGVMMAEIQAGASRSEALERLARRTPSPEVGALSSMLIQSEAVGSSIGTALRVFSEELRKTRYLEAERRAAELPVKMAFPLVFCVFPALSGVVFIPVLLRLMRTFAGM